MNYCPLKYLIAPFDTKSLDCGNRAKESPWIRVETLETLQTNLRFLAKSLCEIRAESDDVRKQYLWAGELPQAVFTEGSFSGYGRLH